MERELKLTLDDRALAHLRAHPLLSEAGSRPLVSTYFDSEDRILATSGFALRVRRDGRRRLQAIKRRLRPIEGGLSTPEEVEFPIRGTVPALDHPAGGPLLAQVRALLHGRTLAPVVETRVARRALSLDRPGGRVELALDEGEIVAGDRRTPIRELEIELLDGPLSLLHDTAEALALPGPLRFSLRNKAERGFALADTGEADAPPGPVMAGSPDPAPDATVEHGLRDALRDCLAQIAGNMVLLADSEAPEGPHQLRVGLRRLRTVLGLFRDEAGRAGAALRDEAQALGRLVGALRDRDVLASELLPAQPLDEAGRAALAAVLEPDRAAVRARVRAALAEPATAAFPLRLGRFVETRGWLDPADWDQTARLARPLAERAPDLLDRCHAKALKRGRHPDRLTVEQRHDLRKALKTLRYAIEMLLPPDEAAKPWLKRLKALQDGFGRLNDAAMAAELLGPGAVPGLDDPAAARAAGFVQGVLSVRLEGEIAAFHDLWTRFRDARPFWR